MDTDQDKSTIDSENEPSKAPPPISGIMPDNQSASENTRPINTDKVKLVKTKWDRIVEGLGVVTTIAMVLATFFIARFANKQWKAAEKQVTAANRQVEAANKEIDLTRAQNSLVLKQTIAAEKEATLADEQIKIAKAQNEFMQRINEEAKISNLKMKRLVSAYYLPGSDMKDKIDLVFINKSARPTSILSIYLRKKDGSIVRTIADADGIKLPLNVAAWSAEKITFVIEKKEIEQLADILVTDMDDNRIITKQDWHKFVYVQDTIHAGMDASASTISAPFKVCINQTVTNSGIIISIQSIVFNNNSGRIYGTISAPGKSVNKFSSAAPGTCLSYGDYSIHVKSISTNSNCAEFIITYNEKPCK